MMTWDELLTDHEFAIAAEFSGGKIAEGTPITDNVMDLIYGIGIAKSVGADRRDIATARRAIKRRNMALKTG